MKKSLEVTYPFLPLERKVYGISWMIIIPCYFYILKHFLIVPLMNNLIIDTEEVYWGAIVALCRNILTLVVIGFVFRDYVKESLIDICSYSFMHMLKWVGRGIVYVVCGRLIYGVLYAILIQTGMIDLQERIPQNQTMVDALWLSHSGLAFLSAVIIAPIVEEFIFRVIIFQTFRKINAMVAIVGSSLVFGAVHIISEIVECNFLAPFYALSYFVTAIALALLYERRRNIIPCIVLHMILNLVSLL